MASDYSAITQHNERQLGLDTASRKTQICMYSDSTHFIYELLQNADDYDATEVVFALTGNELVIEHNGQPFAEENVKAITYFGKSTSREDLVKTGRFGVGFKSVFAFTATPVVLSGDEHFMIHGLYRVSEHPRPEGLSRNRTRIILPFNHVTERPDYVEHLMPPDDAYSKIAERLSGLNMNTLLFTRHIREIRWETEHRVGHYLREDQPRDNARYTTITDGESLHRYLVFARTPTWHAQQHKAVEIAFALDAKDQITPTDECLYVLFTTTQETHLQFIVNGPYRTNPSRETIAEDDPFNVHLMGETCSLMRDVLPHIRDSALLTTAFLSVLPNPDDKLRPFYKPLLTAVVARFREENLVPTDNGGHAMAAAVVQGPAAIREVVTTAELPFLAGKSAANWVKGVQPNTRPDVFLRALGIKSWGYEELQATLDKKFGGGPYYPPPVAPSDATWLCQRADAWMQKLYVLLGDAIKREEFSQDTLQWCRVIRVMEDRHENHVSGPNAYFPKGRGFRDLAQIKHSIVRGRSAQHAKKIEAGLAALGVTEIGDEQRVELILEAYYNNERPTVSAEQHIGHMRSFIKWWKKKESTRRYRSHSIFRTAQGEDYKSADNCYVDAPLSASGLAVIYRKPRHNIEPKLPLWVGYKKLIGEGFRDFAVACGVMDRLCIEHQSSRQHPRAADLQKTTGAAGRARSGTDDDYIIPGLTALLLLKDVKVNALLWNVMCKADPDVLEARYRTNTQKSSLVLYLSKAAWIPDRRRILHKPAEMTKAKLHPDFRYDNRNTWLDEIGFGEAEKLADREYQKQRESAQALGCPPKIVDLINSRPATERGAMWQRCEEMLRKSVAERKRAQWLQQNPVSFHEGFMTAFRCSGIPGEQTDGFTSGLSKNPKRRTEKLTAEISAAIRLESSLEGRFSFQVRKTWKGKNDKVKEALLQWYHGRCQICGWTFAQRNGQPYFEGLYLVPYTHAEWVDRPGNVVCLCPQHSAMFQFGTKEVAGDVMEVVANFTPKVLGGMSEPVLKLTLCGQDVALAFSENHFLELKVMLVESLRTSGE